MATKERITREEALRRAKVIASVVPGATVRRRAWNITVVLKSGKHLVFWVGNKDGFVKP